MNYSGPVVGTNFETKFPKIGTNALSSHMTNAVDSLLGGKTFVTNGPTFTTITDNDAGPFVRNASFWGVTYIESITGEPPSNSATNTAEQVIAITPRHCIGIKHGSGYPADGSTLRFVTSDGTIVLRDISQHTELTALDLCVMLLDEDLPGTIDFIKVAPDNITTYLTAAVPSVPLMTVDAERKGIVADMFNIYSGGVSIGNPSTSERRAFYEVAVAGDSGGPWMGVINGEFVLFAVTVTANDGAGMAGNNSAINTAIGVVDALGSVSTGYTVTNPTLTSFSAI